ncbi:aquaporin-like protein [Apodospora peruviana]|uniref:Aquaporin-like protein n=1 Tax=Apodospora peruviana TaxID=516989 RepID=A0AAE0IUG6_9PEZI|nr:aquaporin-like protein [Apodospora peruviana]
MRFPSFAGVRNNAADTGGGAAGGTSASASDPSTNPAQKETTQTLPMLSLPGTVRNNVVATLGEFVGTFLFLFFAFAGTQVANMSPPRAGSSTDPDPINVAFISVVFGMSLMANVWAFYRVTGGLFNPCVSLLSSPLWCVTMALYLVGGLPGIRSCLVVVAQLLAGIAAAGVVAALFPGPMLVNTTLGGGASVVQGLFIEMFLTAQLVFVIIMVAAEKHKSTFLAPVAIGVAFFLCELVGVYFTGGSLNPARSLGPAVVNHSFPGYFWIYWIGPALGSLLACGFYVLLKYLRWKECNPGQDYDDEEAAQRSSSSKHHHPHPVEETKAPSPKTEDGVLEVDRDSGHQIDE